MTLTEVHVGYDSEGKGQDSKGSQRYLGQWFLCDLGRKAIDLHGKLGLQMTEAEGDKELDQNSIY